MQVLNQSNAVPTEFAVYKYDGITYYNLFVDHSLKAVTAEYLTSQKCKFTIVDNSDSSRFVITSMPKRLLDYHIKRFNADPNPADLC
jgi:hypothetical protein